ncbi:hypothetical protein FRC07_012536 [Ceratobasidium sp. 392]|nr:hypothetical protein FRC07_012536 [Ceratobasidium sp. 392]
MPFDGNSNLPPPYEPGDNVGTGDPLHWAAPSDPPAFDADVVPGYDTTTPSKLYNIGKLSTLPLVTIAELKAHLLLLGAFEQLKRKCEEADLVDLQKKLPPLRTEAKWPLFLERARERFDLWVAKVVNGRPGRTNLWHEEIPPLDVLVIWHAYLLNPIQYYEDVSRIHPVLDKIPEFPLYKISAQIDLETLELLPTEEQYHHWQRTTGDCFGLPLNTTPDADTINIKCPSCGHINEVIWTSTPDASGKFRGFAQQHFLAICEGAGCGFSITWDALCTKRFADDVISCRQDTEAVLGGTLTNTSSGSPDAIRGRRLTEDILTAFPSTRSAAQLAESLRWSMQEVLRRLEKEFEAPIPGTALPRFGKARVPSLLAAYSVPYAESFPAVAAAHRLSTFTSILHELDYLTPGIFDQDAEPLLLALDRFHGFLDVATRGSTKRPMTPTLDIDLVWHTMMLRPHAYREAIMKFVGRVLPHDDMIEEGKMSLSFNEAVGIWKERQQTQYSMCGCLNYLSPSTSASSSSSGLRFWKKSNQETAEPSNKNNHPPNSVNTHLATHPSDHNSIVIQGLERVDWLRDRRRERFAEDAAKAAKGKGKSRAGGTTELERGVDHERAFLRSVDGEAQAISNLESWGLRANVDPRLIDGKLVNRGVVIVGIDAQVSPAANMHTAAAASSGFSATSTGW